MIAGEFGVEHFLNPVAGWREQRTLGILQGAPALLTIDQVGAGVQPWYALRMFRGGCLCGAVRYEIEGAPVIVAHCHCTDCQRLSGAGHTTGAMFSTDEIQIRGEVSEFRLESYTESVVTRTFCPRCGSPLFGRNSRMAGFMTVSVGTLDDPDSVSPQVVVFARTKRRWDLVSSALPTFDTQPDWKPEDGA